MIPLIRTHCHKCGYEGEGRLTFAGPHIKRTCRSCGAYQDFFTKTDIPDVTEIKLRIWAISDEDLNLINKAKEEIGFTLNGMKPLYVKMMYWKLYLNILKKIEDAISTSKNPGESV